MTTGTWTFRHSAVRRVLPILVCGLIAVGSMMGLRQDGSDDQRPGQPIQNEGRVIHRVEFEGLQAVDGTYLRNVVRIAAGDVWERDTIAHACTRLAATGKFEGSPYAEARDVDGRLILIFVVHERPFLTDIDFTGNKKFKDRELLKDIELSIGSPINDYLLNQAKQKLERKYRDAGYAHATAEIDASLLQSEQLALFRISEGPRIKVRDIDFEGNTAFSGRKLRSEIETATYVWIFRTGAFDDEIAERDCATIEQYYRDRGYLNAQVGYRTELDENQSDLGVIFIIEEGLLHFIKSIEYVGNTVFSNEDIAGFMELTPDRVINAEILKADRERILKEYGRIGHIYSQAVLSHVFDEEDGFINLTVTVHEGSQYRFGRIAVRGNRHTQDKVIRRELRFFPEELYNSVEVKRAEQRLRETRLFNEATITPQGDVPGIRDALVDVTEGDTTTILFGVGIATNSGVVGSISIEQRNFDLFDWPRTAKEFFKGRSFKGAGQSLRLSFEPGTEFTRGRLEFREPYLFDKELGFSIGLYGFERGREEYNERRIGFFTSVDKRFREGFLKNWATELALRVESVGIGGTDMFTAPEIIDDKGTSLLTSVKGTLVRDTTDSIWLPSEGNKFKVSLEQAGLLGGDHAFGKLIGEYAQYWTLRSDAFDRKHIVQVGGTMGHIFGDAPVFEKFHAGGLGSIRGFEYRGISPRAGWRSDRVGGDFMVLANAQYSFPLVGKTIRGVTFLDMGTVEEGFEITDWRASIGFGARIYIQYFGPIPLSFDFGIPITHGDNDDTQIFSFSFGTTF